MTFAQAIYHLFPENLFEDNITILKIRTLLRFSTGIFHNSKIQNNDNYKTINNMN